MAKGTHVTYSQEDDRQNWIADQFCEIAHVTEGMPMVGARIILPKNSSWTRLFNQAIEREMLGIRRIRLKYLRMRTARRDHYCPARARFNPPGGW